MSIAIVWFRRDLRLADNAALDAARRHADALLALYIHDSDSDGLWSAGAASNWWLHHSLVSLDEGLRRIGSRLIVRRGNSMAILDEIIRRSGAMRLFYNRLPEPAQTILEHRVEQHLASLGVAVLASDGALLHDPQTLHNASGAAYRVFTPFWKACQRHAAPRRPLPAPKRLPPPPARIAAPPVASLELLPKIRWDAGLADHWQPGEPHALRQLKAFTVSPITDYPETRDLPAATGTSRLSPALHFGEVTPRQILHRISASGSAYSAAAPTFLRQVGWREFAHHLLHHFPHTGDHPLDPRFRHFPWRSRHAKLLRAWQQGTTGIPLVDAGMRELWHTGWMHNRVRMVTASFLTKNLRIPWQAGARWFWDTLVDADLANNTLGWQWVAGCGADAAPYFRIFNPVLQGKRFDVDGEYMRRWLPELAALPDRWLHQPWKAPDKVLVAAGLRLGHHYPRPVVDLTTSRREALAAYESVKRRTEEPG